MNVLQLGSKGADVVEAQRLLNDHGVQGTAADGSPLLPLVEDGAFGDRTRRATVMFQRHEAILDDGKIGPTTWSRLERKPVEPTAPEDPALHGLLIDGKIVQVPGVRVINPSDAAWAHLSPGDCTPRKHRSDGSLVDVSTYIWHKTIADYPERLLPGVGPTGGARATADYWRRTNPDGSQEHYGGAHLITGEDGEVACLADLRRVEAYHVGTVANQWSVGHETREKITTTGSTKLNDFWEASANATIATTLVACAELGIQLQMHRGAYSGHPMKRMLGFDGKSENGGADVVGIFTHRDYTESRGKWDPGEIMLEMLHARDTIEAFDFEAREDIATWKERQRKLVQLGHQLVVDGIPGRATVAALKAEGYAQGIWALGRASFHG